MFKQATDLDPNSAEAWAGLADALHTMGVYGDEAAFDQAKVAAKKALEIDPSQAQALMALGAVAFLYDWDPAQSEDYLRQAIAARPSYAMAHAIFATILGHRGKIEEAIQEIKLAAILDPVSVTINSFAWHVYFCARRYDDALQAIIATNEMDPTFRPAYWRLVTSWEQKGEYNKAIDAWVRGRIVGGETPESVTRMPRNSALRLPREDHAPTGSTNWIDPARRSFRAARRDLSHAPGNREESLKTLEEGYQRRRHYLIVWIAVYPEFDALRSEPRYQKLLHDLGLS